MDPDPAVTYDDFVRPGQEGFSSFPKSLPDDCVHYTIHTLDASLRTPAALRSRLVEIRNAATALTKSLLKDYIWQHESFNLAIYPPLDGSSEARSSPAEPLHLRGKTSYGDSIADEWLIVYLLHKLSDQFPDAWIRVWDADGEFLLVEAANSLPKWLNPEVAEHRVWINRGEVKIIPRYLPSISTTSAASSSASNLPPTAPSKSKTEPLTPRILTLATALTYLQTNPPRPLLHDATLEAEALHRIQPYPSAIKTSLHTTRATLPRNLAYILHRCPAHISPAISAFYLRDPIALAPLRRADTEPNSNAASTLKFLPADLVTVPVRFTRVGYAQLRGQQFAAPNKAWAAALAAAAAAEGEESRRRVELGMKIACGFEMMIGAAADVDARAVREAGMLLEDLESGDETLPADEEVASWGEGVEDDGEEWLDVDFEEFERELEGKGRGVGFGDREAQVKLRRMVEKFEELLKEDVDADGFRDEMDFDDDDDDEEDEDDEDDSAEEDGAGIASDDDEDEPDMLQQPFDEEKFKAMMRQLGLPLEQEQGHSTSSRVWEVGSDDDDDNENNDNDAPESPEEMRKLMEQMEAELRQLGAFNGR